MNYKTISYDEWLDQFKPLSTDDQMIDTHDKISPNIDPALVWSMIDGDSGWPVWVSGIRRVNAVCFGYCQVAVPEGVVIKVE